jgi:hypothetical protein
MSTRQKQPRSSSPRSPKNEEPSAAPDPPETFTLELTLQEMGFLRLLLTNATIQPAELKKLCGEVQAKIEAHIGPLPPPG